MKDPFPLPQVRALRTAVEPFAERWNVPTLPLHIHEVVFATVLYTVIHLVVSPRLSTWLFPGRYPTARGKRANWDSHIVSMFQSVLINILALWAMAVDEERKGMALDWQQRIWGYTGATGLVQAFAAGYFIWDLAISVLFVDVFGLGLLAHATSALSVYLLGFRPFLHYYGNIFILYELSTPFLNIHWFFDKLDMTGSWAQLVNGITLIVVFFSCRLVWGTFQSVRVYMDIFRAVRSAPSASYMAAAHWNSTLGPAPENVMAFATDAKPIPLWLALALVGSNLTLNGLNWFWFFKMITAVKKRFEPAAKEAKEKEPIAVSAGISDVPAQGAVSTAAEPAEETQGELKKRNAVQ